MKKVLFVLTAVALMFPMIASAQTKTAANYEIQTEVACESFSWINGVTYTSDTVAFLMRNDTLYVLDLEIHHNGNYTATVTAGCKYEWGGETYTSDGTYNHTFTDRFGCDSAVTLTLTIEDTNRTTLDTVVCKKLVWRGHTFTTDTIFTDTVDADPQAGTCAELHTLNLTVNRYGIGADIDTTVCKRITWHGTTYTTESNFKDTVTYTAATKCDSIFDVTIHIITPTEGTVSDTTVKGCGYVSFGSGSNIIRTYETIDTNRLTIVTTGGQCIENRLNIHMIINPAVYTTIDTTSCGTFVIGSYTYDASDVDTFKVGTSAAGCDSNLILNLTVYEDLSVHISGVLDILPGEGTTLTGSCDHDDATLVWSYDGQTSTEPSITLSNLQENTDVALTATSADQNCSRTAYVTVMVSPYVAGIVDADASSVSIFPNPTTAVVNINSPKAVESVVLYNMAGQKLEAFQTVGEQLSIDLSRYNNGIYMLSLRMTDGSVVNQKIAVKK